ncbi:recombinase family protein [Sulfobacillus sp. DSM 109850]|uniref:Recombinase family protein n=1 Tax=Sulfobacillus harzensis TaxID=2729629 RepID=A0A7Y0Q4R3_9FIRM|nr:recombinase family protein [Sulfobacillus harzensis]NMP24680.1 recombinase family protein [Sulfobacillus harzensis]
MVDRVFVDKASGKDVHRPQLDQLLAFVREGNTLVVYSMDRLARNLDDLRKLVQTLTRRGVRRALDTFGLDSCAPYHRGTTGRRDSACH